MHALTDAILAHLQLADTEPSPPITEIASTKRLSVFLLFLSCPMVVTLNSIDEFRFLELATSTDN